MKVYIVIGSNSFVDIEQEDILEVFLDKKKAQEFEDECIVKRTPRDYTYYLLIEREVIEPKQEFTIDQIRRIHNDAPESWNKSLAPYETQAIELITQLYPEKLGEGVYNVLAELLSPCLRRGQFDLELYEKVKELKKVSK